MAQLQLQPHVSFAVVDHAILFLDLRRDRYFELTGSAARAFDVLRRKPESALDDEAAAPLLATGLFVRAAEPAQFSPPDIRPPGRDLPDTASRNLAPTDLIEIWSLVSRARRALRSRPLEQLIEGCRSRARDRSGRRSTDETVALSCRFRRARAWVPIKPSCLQDSLALHQWLSRRRAAAPLVLGVKLDPFAAHCWLQLGRTVLNDRIETVGAFTPILAVG